MTRLLKSFLKYFSLVLIIVTLNFMLPRVMPGDPMVFIFGEEIYGIAVNNPELFAQFVEKYGLNLPLIEQYRIHLINFFTGDWGYSFSFGRPVFEIIAERLPFTLLLTVPATLLSLLVGIAIGLKTGWRPNRISSRITTSICLLIHSVPSYWLSMVFLLVFSLWFRLTPIGGAPRPDSTLIEAISHLILPFSVLLLFNTAYIAMIVRGLTVEISEEDFIATAISKGLKPWNFSIRHLLRPSLPPLIFLTAIELGFTLSGALLVEIVFNWPGIGYTMLQAVIERDYPLIHATFTIVAIAVITANAIGDLFIGFLDPRVRNNGDIEN